MITTISYTGKMKKIILLSGLIFLHIMFGYAQDAQTILDRIDKNMVSKTEITESEMVIRGKRNVQTIGSKSYTEGNKKSFTEYLYPERERGTKKIKQ